MSLHSMEDVLIADKYEAYKAEANARWDKLKANEEELNRIFAEIYGMEDEVPVEVEDKYVSVARVFDTEEEIPESFKGNKYVLTKRDVIVSLISYAVGVMFGRYSLDEPGLILADGKHTTLEDYRSFMSNPAEIMFFINSEIIPIYDEPGYHGDAYGYSDDEPDCHYEDVADFFYEFVDLVYGTSTREENLRFVAQALNPKSRDLPLEVIRQYFLKDFFADHCRTYKKRPIYWLFDSGKKNGFKALVYLHRYTPDTLAIMRTDYVHPQQERYRNQLGQAYKESVAATGPDAARCAKLIKGLNEKLAETAAFEERLHHLADMRIALDLDDGVKVNYAKLQDVLAKIK